MGKVSFYKYQGTGNDFVIIDNRELIFDKNNLALVAKLCDRKFGVGADGLILIENHPTEDFDLIYFNSDGSKSFCGNGSRCGVAFAKFLGIIENSTSFNAIDGVHEAKIEGDLIHLKMNDVVEFETGRDYFFMNTGSPHYIKYVEDLAGVDILNEAHKVRYGKRFVKEGTNVNFVEIKGDKTSMRTYERGVEDETLSCGTGATAVAIATAVKHRFKSPIAIKVAGGELKISFDREFNNTFANIWLIGEGKQVFKGEIVL